MFPTVFKDEVASRVEYVPFQDFVRNIFQPLESIRRIGEDYVELLLAYREKVEDVGVHAADVPQAEP